MTRAVCFRGVMMKALAIVAALALAGCASASNARSRRDAGSDVSLDRAVMDTGTDGAEAGDAPMLDAGADAEADRITVAVAGPCVDGTLCTETGINGLPVTLACVCRGGSWRCSGWNMWGQTTPLWISGFSFPAAPPMNGQTCSESLGSSRLEHTNFACAFPNRCGTVCSCSDRHWFCAALAEDGGGGFSPPPIGPPDGACPWSICGSDSGANYPTGTCDGGAARCVAVSCRVTNPCSKLYSMDCDNTER